MIKGVQKIHGNDMENFKNKMRSNNGHDGKPGKKRAIISMVKLIEKEDNLGRILSYINYLYHDETKSEKTQALKEQEKDSAEKQDTL